MLYSGFFCIFLRGNAYQYRNPGAEKFLPHVAVGIHNRTDRAVAAGELQASRLPARRDTPDIARVRHAYRQQSKVKGIKRHGFLQAGALRW